MHGARQPHTNLWHTALNTEANNVYHTDTMHELIQFLHAACGNPVPSTWIKATDAGHFATWPGLTSDNVRKHLPKSLATAKGHLEWVKSFFGIALLALAVSYLRDGFSGFGGLVEQLAASLGRVGAVSLAAALAFVLRTVSAGSMTMKIHSLSSTFVLRNLITQAQSCVFWLHIGIHRAGASILGHA